jgi:hypothetical protein
MGPEMSSSRVERRDPKIMTAQNDARAREFVLIDVAKPGG